MSKSESRQYDIVIWGCTGFTGRLACEYVAKTYPDLKWAIAGRKRATLDEIKTSLKLTDIVGIIVADIADFASLQLMASSTTVLLSTAGPYAKIGTPVLSACIENDTHYVDITGEIPWIRDMIDKYSVEAAHRKLRIVSCCGFDCIPCDLGNQMIVEELQKKGVTNVGEVRFTAYEVKGGASGGTMHSMLNMFASNSISALLALTNPYYLNPTDEEDKKKRPIKPTKDRKVLSKAGDKMVFAYDSIHRCWGIPYIMQSVDTRVVNRSNALMDFAYGRNFVFTERLKVPGFFVALLSMLAMPLLGLFFLNPIGRSFMRCVLPSPGQGPSQDLLDNGYMRMKLWGKGTDAAGKEVLVKGSITALNGDPGYRQTAKMASEAAICLALDQAKLPERFGLLTPASSMGDVLRERLGKQGMHFDVEN